MSNGLVLMNGLHSNPILLSRGCQFMRKGTSFSMMPVRSTGIWRVNWIFLVRYLPTRFVVIVAPEILVAAQAELFDFYLDPAFADACSKF
jgi:hypothetical protein